MLAEATVALHSLAVARDHGSALQAPVLNAVQHLLVARTTDGDSDRAAAETAEMQEAVALMNAEEATERP